MKRQAVKRGKRNTCGMHHMLPSRNNCEQICSRPYHSANMFEQMVKISVHAKASINKRAQCGKVHIQCQSGRPHRSRNVAMDEAFSLSFRHCVCVCSSRLSGAHRRAPLIRQAHVAWKPNAFDKRALQPEGDT